MLSLPNKYGNFSDLERLDEVLTAPNVIVAFGDAGRGPHVTITAPESHLIFTFTQVAPGRYELEVRRD